MRMTEAQLRKVIRKEILREMHDQMPPEGLDSKIHNSLEEIDEMSGGNGGKISLAKLANDLGTTVEQVIDALSDQEFEYWTELHLDKGVVEVLPGGYQNQ
jgi:hypothetical protein